MKTCPSCGSINAWCPECGDVSPMGERTSCARAACRERQLDCIGCQKTVDADGAGVVDFVGKLIPWKEEA